MALVPVPVGSVAGLWRYAVKSMAGERRERCRLAPGGLPGDRGWAVCDAGTGAPLSAKRIPFLMSFAARFIDEPSAGHVPHAEITLPGGERVRTDDPQAASLLGRSLKRGVALARGPGHFDAYELHLLTTASLKALAAAAPDVSFDPRRFRPNIVVGSPAGATGFPELAWRGRRLRVGGATLRVAEPTERCVMTTLPQPGLGGDARILKTLVAAAGRDLGVYATVESSGDARLGDPVELLPEDLV